MCCLLIGIANSGALQRQSQRWCAQSAMRSSSSYSAEPLAVCNIADLTLQRRNDAWSLRYGTHEETSASCS